MDKSYEWTADALNDWYEIPKPKLDQDERETAASLLWVLKGDAVQRIVTAWHLGWEPALEASGTEWQPRFLAELLNDDYATIRYVAGRSMKRFLKDDGWNYDFIASPAEREESKAAAIDLWRRSNSLSNDERNATLLIKADGTVNLKRMNRLLSDRDNRPITLPE